jgi:uncharacterized protein YcnI
MGRLTLSPEALAVLMDAIAAAKAYFHDEDSSDALFYEAALKVDRACELLGTQGGEG